MRCYRLHGIDVTEYIATLPDDVKEQIWEDFEQLYIDPTNKLGDPDSAITKDRDREHAYSIAVADGRILIFYEVHEESLQVEMWDFADLESGGLSY